MSRYSSARALRLRRETPLVVERQGDVFDGVLVIDQVEGLENIADHIVACGGGLRFAEVLDQPSGQVVTAAVVVVENPEDVEQGRFPGSRGAHDRDQFALFDVEVDTFEHVQGRPVVIGLVDVFQLYHIQSAVIKRFALLRVTICKRCVRRLGQR